MHQWHPTAPLNHLQLRAKVLKNIRSFFEAREVLEVETPLICHSTVTDPHLASFHTLLEFEGLNEAKKLYLQTSPEFAMKRLLAAGYGSIYQICKAFRNGEVSKKHNPEFTILEWYRVGFTHIQLMDEMDQLLTLVLSTEKADRISYHNLFQTNFAINPHTCSITDLKKLAANNGLSFQSNEQNKDLWLDLIMTHLVEPTLGLTRPIFIYDYPASQAALAKTRRESDFHVGERFEVYFKGLELANGYHELGDSKEQLKRLNLDNELRAHRNLPVIPIDDRLLEALHSFPECAGVAMGFDRLLCLAANTTDLSDMIAFPIARA
ncbi:MAG: elongation factor P--(R)-beta-lysine ligase [Gammaproteobacteria bacterium]|nr:elongation factor P--(R)-beta-lysine ligase [Gammaproteobacteria bacterium]